MLILLTVLLAVSQTAPPIPGKAPNGPAGAGQSVGDKAGDNQKPPANPLPSLNPVTANPQQETSKTPQPKNEPQPVRITEFPSVSVSRDWADWGLWFFNGLLVLVGFLGVRLAYKTLSAIEKQTKATEIAAEATKISADATKESVEAINRQVGIMERQTKVMETAGEVAALSTRAAVHSQRPWLSVNVSVASALTFDEQGVHITLNIALSNVGKMPAMGVQIHPEIYLISPVKLDATEERKRLCREAVERNPDQGHVIFPDQQPAVFQYTINASAAEIEACARAIFREADTTTNPAHRVYFPMIIVAIAYRTGMDESARYYTAVTYQLNRRDETNVPGLALIIGETVPPERLAMYMWPIGGIIAQ